MAGKWGGMARQPQVGHLPSSNELADRATEVRLRARATKALVTGIALVDAALEVARDPIRARAPELAKAKGATARGKAKAANKASPSVISRLFALRSRRIRERPWSPSLMASQGKAWYIIET